MNEIRQASYYPGRSLSRSINWFSYFLLAIIWGLFALWAHSFHEDTLHTTEEILKREEQLITKNVSSILQHSSQFLHSASIWIRRNSGTHPRNDPEFLSFVASFQKNTDQLMLVRAVDRDGTLHLIEQKPNGKPANVADRDYFIGAMQLAPGEIFISKPFQGRSTGKWAVSLATRLPDNPYNLAVLFIAIELPMFEKIFETTEITRGNSVALIRSDGILLARSGAKPVQLGIDLSQTPTFKIGLPQSSSGIIQTDSPYTDNISRLIAYRALKDFPLVIAVGTPTEKISKTIANTLIPVATLLLLATWAMLLMRHRALTLLKRISDDQVLLENMANHDQLTGILNRRRFLEACNEAINLAHRYESPLCLLLLDLDHFKSVNDNYGHPAGDYVLKAFADEVQTELRNVDYFGRLGGEEFGVLLQNTPADGALQLAERIRTRIAAFACDHKGQRFSITVSIGLATLNNQSDYESLYAAADRALYIAKHQGRNQCCLPKQDHEATS